MNITNILDWRAETGMYPLHIDSFSDEKYLLLDGGSLDLCLDLTGTADDVDAFYDKGWSANTRNCLIFRKSDVLIYNYYSNKSLSVSLSNGSVDLKNILFRIRNLDVKSNMDIVPFSMKMFRKLRNLVGFSSSPEEKICMFYKLLISLEENIDIHNIDTKYWHIEDVQLPKNIEIISEAFKAGINGRRPVLDMILRHSASRIFEEAHRQVAFLDTRKLLFGRNLSSMMFDKDIESGTHYTPQYLVRSIVEQVLKEKPAKEDLYILDPACGSGTFLDEMMKQLAECEFRGKIKLKGMDSSQIAIKSSIFVLEYARRKMPNPENVSIDIHEVDDSLAENWGHPDIIVMNPPFISWKEMDKKSKERVAAILSPLDNKCHPNMAAAFLRRAVDSLSEAGVLGIVLPYNLMSLETYGDLRKNLEEQVKIKLLSRLGYNVFSDVVADTGFLICSKEKTENAFSPVFVYSNDTKDTVSKTLMNLRKFSYTSGISKSDVNGSVYIPVVFPIKKNSWSVISRDDASLLEILSTKLNVGLFKHLNKIFSVKQGINTGAKRIYEISSMEYNSIPPKFQKYFRPLVGKGSIFYGTVEIKEYIWFPYDNHGNSFFAEDSDLPDIPFIGNLRNNKVKLESRKVPSPFWELSYPRLSIWENPIKILCDRVGSEKSFAISKKRNEVIMDGECLILKDGYIEEDYYFYIAFLCSRLFGRLLSIFANRKKAAFDLGNSQIKDIPLPDAKKYRDTPFYERLCDVGRAMSKGDEYVHSIVDDFIKDFALYENE